MVNVSFPRRISRRFYEKCRAAYPCEEYAILLGTITKSEIEIEDLYFPPERLKNLHPDYVDAKPAWLEDAHRLASGIGLEVVGEIHSHCYNAADGPYPGLDPSEADWDRGAALRLATAGRYRLMGIVRVLKRGPKYHCRTRFWPAIDLPVTIR